MTSKTAPVRAKAKKNLLAYTTAMFGVAALAAVAPAYAQDEDEAIVVTGSRIANTNLVATSPVTTVGQEDLSLSNTANAEQFLNTLPQVIPGFDSSSNNPGIGESTVDLRGLGPQRTLVLVNGRRYVSSNQNAGVVDLNTIPASLVQKVEILTGGASAVYGSDAMSGVVNFIMKDDFEGLEFDNSYQITEEGDGDIFDTSLTMGSNLDNGRGNVVLNLGYTSRGSVFQGDRPDAFFTLADAGAGNGFAKSGSVNIPSTFVLDFTPDFTAALGIPLPCSAEGTVEATDDNDNPLGFCTTNFAGWLFSPNGPGAQPFINQGDNTSRYNFAPVNYLQIPQERYNIYGSFNYDLGHNVEAYAQAVYVSSQTEQLLAATPVGSVTVTVNLDNPFLAGDTQALALLTALSTGDSDGNGVPDAQILTFRRSLELAGRLSDIRNDSFQFAGGLRGDIGETWTWDVYGAFGQAGTTITQSGNVSVSAYQAAIRENRANIFDAGGVDPAVVAEYEVLGTITGTTEETTISATASGQTGIQFPWAENAVGIAFGTEYREEFLTTEGAGLGPDIVGFNQAPSTEGSYDVYELFGEINVPLVEGAPLAEDISLNGAYRYSDYSTVGGVESYAGGASWTPIHGLRFRGQYQRAVRAPNIGELFQPQINGFPGVSDPCSGGANGGWNDLTAAQQTITRAQCEANGVPSAAVGGNLQVNAQIEGLFGGNPNLQQESSDTYTIGAVMEPSFIDNLAVTVDYYDITINDVVGNIPSQTLFDLCFINAVDQYCSNFTRTPAGTIDIFTSVAQNSAQLNAKGVDITVDYKWDVPGIGSFGIYSLIGWRDQVTFQALPTTDPYNCVGYYGATCGQPLPEWTFNTRFDWSNGPWGARLRWQRISSVKDDLLNPDLGDPADADLFVTGVDAYNQVDLTGFYDLTENVLLSVGVLNLLEPDYVLIGEDSNEQANTYPATYDTLGRTFFGRVLLKF